MSSSDRIRSVSKLAVKALALFLATSVGAVLLLKFVDPFTSSFIVQKKLQAVFSRKQNTTIRYQWLDYQKISPHMRIAVVAAEDQNFPRHFGFDLKAIEQALKHNKKSKRLRGASTISQQVAKNLFLWPGRSLFRKGLEAYFTLLMEVIWGKKRILEMYLNIVEMGDMVFGVQAASYFYYKKSAGALTPQQAAQLAAVLPNPIKYSVKGPSAYVRRRTAWILRHMQLLGGEQYLKGVQ